MTLQRLMGDAQAESAAIFFNQGFAGRIWSGRK